jgi:signal transduction histidine kinase
VTSTSASALHDERATALARLFERVRDGIYVGLLAVRAEDADATIVVNPHLRKLFGFGADVPESQIQPLSLARFVDPADRTRLLERLRKSGHVNGQTVAMRRIDGAEVLVEVNAFAVTADDRFLTVDALLRETTATPGSVERHRDAHHQEVAHAERLAALGYALSSVAHELNNPLASIIGWAEQIAEAPLSDASRRGAPLLLREAQRAARIVRNLLTLSRKRPSTRALADLNQLVRETLALRAQDQRELHISVTAALTPALPQVFVDGHQIQQVLLNLLINAEQAMTAAHGRGALMVRTSFDERRRRVSVDVADDGPGVSLQVKDRIFDPFFTTKAAGEGTGLGLTVAHAIVRDHGGEIQLSSPVSGGAMFTIQLPVIDASTSAAGSRG